MIAVLGQLPTSASTGPVTPPTVTWLPLAPTLAFFVGALLLLLLGSLLPNGVPLRLATGVTVVAAIASAALAVPTWHDIGDVAKGPSLALGGAVGVDGFAVVAGWVVAVAVVLCALLMQGLLARQNRNGVEVLSLLLFASGGAMVLASANDLIVVFVGIEILSLAAYVLAASNPLRIASLEAGLKYFVLGSVASAFLLYGISLLYGSTGTTRLGAMRSFLDTSGLQHDNVLLGGIAMVLVGLGFKIAAVPFHWWTPDVYQGSPTPVTAFMASVVKLAAFAAMVRIVVVALPGQRGDWRPVIEALAVLSLVVGALGALAQDDVKRILAYSSINHAGFILLGIDAATDRGISAVLFYLAVYALMVIGAFGVVGAVSGVGDTRTRLSDLRGLPASRGGMALALTLFVMAQAGVPFTAGFFAKFGVVSAAVEENRSWLAVVAMLSAVISTFVYLRIVGAMYWPGGSEESDAADEDTAGPAVPLARTTAVAVALCAAGVLFVGIFPGPLEGLTRQVTVLLG